jgi:hypothetical protein
MDWNVELAQRLLRPEVQASVAVALPRVLESSRFSAGETSIFHELHA